MKPAWGKHLLSRWFLAQFIFFTLKMEAIISSETYFDFQRTTRRYIPEDRTLHNHCCENLQSYIAFTCSCHFLYLLPSHHACDGVEPSHGSYSRQHCTYATDCPGSWTFTLILVATHEPVIMRFVVALGGTTSVWRRNGTRLRQCAIISYSELERNGHTLPVTEHSSIYLTN
jgi:hypothetical protein